MEISQSVHQHGEENVLQRIVHLPMISSVLQMVSSAYTDVKDRYALVGLVGNTAEISARSMSQAAARRAMPILQRLEPPVRMVNSYAGLGLDQLEKRVPILHQSVEEIMGHLKDALFLTLDDLQLWVNGELDNIQDRAERVMEVTQNALWTPLRKISNSTLGTAVATGLDNLLVYSEEAVHRHLHLIPQMQQELQHIIQQYENENDEEEPGMWARMGNLLLYLSFYIYQQALQLWERLQDILHELSGLYGMMDSSRLTEAVTQLFQGLKAFAVTWWNQLLTLKDAVVSQLSGMIRMILDSSLIIQATAVFDRMWENMAMLFSALQELSNLQLQLLINITPLYNMLQRPSEQQLEQFLIQEYLSESSSLRRTSVNSLLSKTPGGLPRRRRGSHTRFRRCSSGSIPVSERRGSLKQDPLPFPSPPPETEAQAAPSANVGQRHSSASEVLPGPHQSAGVPGPAGPGVSQPYA